MAAPSTRYKTINSHCFTWTGLLKCSGRAVAIPPSLSLYSPAKKGGLKAKDWNLMSYRLPHSLVPARRRTSICDHRFIPSPANSRVWWCSNRNKNGTEMEQLVYGSNSKGSSEVVVADPLLLEKKKAAIRLGGPAKLQVIADFDATLTKYCIDGGQRQSSHGLLQQLNPEYDVKRQKLFEYYHPLEINPTIPIDEKAKLMVEWWEKTHALLIEGGLTYDGIKNSVANATIAFREGVVELFELFEERNVPVLIFSAGVADVIKEVLKQKLHRSFKNVKIVSNWMVFDQHGHLASFKGKTIHVLNKNEHALDMAAAVHDQLGDINGQIDDNASVQKRTNVLLLGDHIGDLGMSDGLNYETRISVGFLNHGIKNSLASYRNAFDVVYLDDASMWGVVKLFSQLFSTGSE